MAKIIKSLAVIALAGGAAFASMLAFGTARRPAELSSVTAPFQSLDLSGLPEGRRLEVTRGAPLAYRRYDATGPVAVIALHGAAGRSDSMHPLAKALNAAGMTVYVPDLRGHGATGTPGDSDYIGQLDDDLAQLVTQVQREQPKAQIMLLGFSAGAGHAVRFAASSAGQDVDRVVLVAPVFGRSAPEKARGEAWAAPHVLRIMAIEAAARLGIHAFDGMEAVAFAVPAGGKIQPEGYSYRLMRGLLPDDYTASLMRLLRQATVVLADKDEVVAAAVLHKAFFDARPDSHVAVVPGVTHSQLITTPEGIAAILNAIKEIGIEERPDETNADGVKATSDGPDPSVEKPPVAAEKPAPEKPAPLPQDNAPLMPSR